MIIIEGIVKHLEIIILIGFSILGIGLTAFFAGSETVVLSANKMKLKGLARSGNRRAARLNQLLEKPEILLGTLLVGTSLAIVTSAQFAEIAIGKWVGGNNRWHSTIASLIMTPLILIFGELIPKGLGRARANAIALNIAYPLKISSFLLKWANSFVMWITKSLLSIVGTKRDSEQLYKTREELRILATLGESEGVIHKEQRKMIHGVLDLEEQTVGDIMTPLVNVVAVDQRIAFKDFYKIAVESEFSRIPVYRDRTDNVIGVVNILDVIYNKDDKGDPTDIRNFIREVIYVPESKRIITLLRELQARRHHMAAVVDEYGGTVGIVTIEDTLEEIMGRIEDERDEVEAKYSVSDGSIDCDGSMEIDEFNEVFGSSLPEEEYKTIAGLVLKLADRIPRSGESFEYEGLRIIVLESNKRSIRRIRAVKIGNRQ